jgi:hypothetical protein
MCVIHNICVKSAIPSRSTGGWGGMLSIFTHIEDVTGFVWYHDSNGHILG